MSTDQINSEQNANTPFKVLMGETSPELAEVVGGIVPTVVGAGRNVQMAVEGDATDLRRRAANGSFDLYVITLNNVMHPVEAASARVSSLDKSLALVAELRAQTEAPILVFFGGWRHGLEQEVKRAGGDLVFRLPFEPAMFRDLLGRRSQWTRRKAISDIAITSDRLPAGRKRVTSPHPV